MKESIKKIVLRELSWGGKADTTYINKQGKSIIRKQELQHIVCEAQKEVEHKNKPLGKTSPSVIEYRDRDGNRCFHHSTGFYNDAFGMWVCEGLVTRSREEGYQITDYGKLYTATDTRAYEIETWKRKYKIAQNEANRWKRNYFESENERNIERENTQNRVDELYFGKGFMDSDDKGSLQEYVAEDVADICRITEPINISDILLNPIKSSPSNSIINDCLSNIQNEIESIKNTYKE
tara:strand:- start:730 stop:1437 length:708 start_codon:yes stop_codon:yes gene_type:complete